MNFLIHKCCHLLMEVGDDVIRTERGELLVQIATAESSVVNEPQKNFHFYINVDREAR